jgi:uncharacterized protein YcbK (DUF882 family)
LIDRRAILGLGLGATAGLALPSAALASVWRTFTGEPATSQAALAAAHGGGRGLEPRRLSFRNLHTEERLEAAYWRDGAYEPQALEAINEVLRDFRTGEVHPIDPRLLDVLFELQGRVERGGAFQVVSGYRSAQTNAQLRELSAEVAKHSLHMDGKAIDLYLDGVDLAYLRNAALDLAGGGVGYYPESRFIHVDVGPVRRWVGT